MTTLNPIVINKKQYYIIDELRTFDLTYFIGVNRNLRGIIKKKNIPETNYIYGYNKDNKWIESNESYVRAKLLLEKEWCDLNVPKLIIEQSKKKIIKIDDIKEDDTKKKIIKVDDIKKKKVFKSIINDSANIINSEENNNEIDINTLYDIPPAPEILELSKEEMFKDDNNNIIDIEVRGIREHNKCYFKVKDVSIGFQIYYLNDSLTHNKGSYKYDLHYKYFIIQQNKKTKKELYLTYMGFTRLIFHSKKIHYSNYYIMKKWLENFDKCVLKSFHINTVRNFEKSNIGYTYLITSNLINAIKIGFWRGSIDSLRSRYITNYGENIILDYVYTLNPYELEQKTHLFFSKYKLTNELFQKVHYNMYLEFIQSNYTIPNIQENSINYNEYKLLYIDEEFNELLNLSHINILDKYEDYQYDKIENELFENIDVKQTLDGKILINYKNIQNKIDDINFDDINISDLCYLLINNKKELFLTYNGILKVLFSSRTGNAENFQNWATETLFIHQMGTIEQKQELSASLLGLNTKTIKHVFNSSSNKTPTVYLFNLGSANQVLKTDIYLEDDILCKYGCTEDISRRTSEHERNFKKQYQTDISLLIYSIIDPKYIFDAENNIKQYFKSNKINEDDKTELIIINKKNLEQIKQHYRMIQNSYIGRYEEMNKQIIKLESIIKEEIHKNEILQIQHKNEILIEKHKNEILEKEIETNNRISQLEKTVLEQQIKLLTK